MTSTASGQPEFSRPAGRPVPVVLVVEDQPQLLRALVSKYTQGRTLGILGEPSVNVLELNIALDQLPAKSAG